MANLLVNESGPYAIFDKIRKHIHGPGQISKFRMELEFVIECIFCTSVWTTLLALLLWHIEPWIDVGLAAMTIATFPQYLQKD